MALHWPFWHTADGNQHTSAEAVHSHAGARKQHIKGSLVSVEEIMHLDIAERIVLVEEIWDSLAREEVDIPLSEYEKDILDARLASLEADPNNLISWDDIKKRIHA